MTTSEPTSYVILRAPENENGFKVLPNPVSARTAEEAIRKVAEGTSTNGTFVAVPARSWRPLRVRQETQVKLKVEEAADDDA